jgi:hypothetical protein
MNIETVYFPPKRYLPTVTDPLSSNLLTSLGAYDLCRMGSQGSQGS